MDNEISIHINVVRVVRLKTLSWQEHAEEL